MTIPGAPPEAQAGLERLLEVLAADPTAPTTVRDPRRAREVHLADSLSGLDLVRDADRIADLGAGAGFPGLPLAAALPDARFDLIEATATKCAFMERAIEAAGIGSARVVRARAEEWAAAAGREAYGVVTARAVGRLSTLCELASPLLYDGGTLVAWKGRRDTDEEAEAEHAAERFAMHRVEVRHVDPYPGSRNRNLHVYAKRGQTPSGLPRRPGMAKKRPFGA